MPQTKSVRQLLRSSRALHRGSRRGVRKGLGICTVNGPFSVVRVRTLGPLRIIYFHFVHHKTNLGGCHRPVNEKTMNDPDLYQGHFVLYQDETLVDSR